MKVHLGDFKRAAAWDRRGNFGQLCDAARALSKPLKFVRIDLYSKPDGIFLGEFTFIPGAGMEQFSEPSFSGELLAKIKQPSPRISDRYLNP
jgi:hypothetical protein